MVAQPFFLGNREIGANTPPLVIPEIGINHEGSFDKAKQMVDDAKKAGAELVKFQCHITDQEMVPNDVVPGNADVSIWDIIDRCTLTEQEERQLKDYCDEIGIMYLSTPFSREASDRLEDMGVCGFKIGSGECNNGPLMDHIARKGKPLILSTGMNDISMIEKTVEIIKKHDCPLMLMHVTSMYPTPYDKVRLGAIKELQDKFGLHVGLSDHSLGNYTVFAAVALGAVALEKHFTSDKSWPGPDIPISIDPQELEDLIKGSKAIWQAMGGSKTILPEEQPCIDFAYATVCAIKNIQKGEALSLENVWAKRPGTGEILANDLEKLLGKAVNQDIAKDEQLTWGMVNG